MKSTKLLLPLLLLISLSGCSSWIKPEIVTETVYVQVEIPIVARPLPLDLKNMKFRVVTEDTVDSFIEDLDTEEVYIVMTVKDYEILATNVADMKRYILDQKQIIVYYEESLTTK